jgi:hypothetical protein
MDHLQIGDVVRVESLECLGWRDAAGPLLTHLDGYYYGHYFSDHKMTGLGVYLGPDCHGVEPVFSPESIGAAAEIARIALWLANNRQYTQALVMSDARAWHGAGFDLAAVEQWRGIGVWNWECAALWREAGLTVDDVRRAALRINEADGGDCLHEICDDAAEACWIVDEHYSHDLAADDDDEEWWIVRCLANEYVKTWNGNQRTTAYAEAFRYRSADAAQTFGSSRSTDQVLRQTMTYQATSEDGGDCDIEAETMEEAIAEARDWIRAGDYPVEGCRIRVRVEQLRHDGEVNHAVTINVEIEPDHDALIRSAGGNPDCDHEWTSEGEGGCDSNPGVWSCGGTTMKFASHCRHCGLHRVEIHHGSQRNPDDHDTVTYTQPDEWCGECESAECCCN